MLGSTLHNYKILEKIGAGGQGAVYLAQDTRLGRKVVVKVLPPELTAKTANLKRFEREAQLCSQLDHPNICTIYDFGAENGVHFIAMQYLEGKNVRQLVNGKPLELKSALSIAIQVCDALAFAHARNIIHRDIKAGNVVVSSTGQAKILDFGLAKLVEDDGIETGAKIDRHDLTELGIPYGTATYAAPEQARGDKVDYRADIFSTGVLLYEMLTGIWAFQGKTVVEVRYEVLHGTPKLLAEMRPEPMPPRLQEIIDKALSKNPKDRYQKIAAMRDELKQVLQEVSGVSVDGQTQTFAPRQAEGKSIVSKVFGKLFGKSTESSVSRPTSQSPGYSIPPNNQPSQKSDESHITNTSIGDREKKSIAILPFKNQSGDANLQFYEFALADSVITELAQLRSLIVRPSSAITKFQGKDFDPLEAGKELKVNAILSAGFIRSGDKMRVTAQLLDVNSGDLLWRDKIDADASDIFDLQDTIARRILDGLKLELADFEQEKLGRRPTENVEAYEEFLRGRDHFSRFVFRTLAPADCDAAIANFQRATELDPNFALAFSGLGAVFANRVFKGIGDAEDYDRAEAAFTKAIGYDPNIVEARVLMVFIYLSRGEKKKARAEISRLQEQFPNDGALHFVKATLNRLDGEYEKALRSWERLGRLDPAARVISAYNRARIFTYQGKMAEADRELLEAMTAEPNHPLVKVVQARILLYEGQVDKAIEIMRDVLREHPHMEGVRPILAISLAANGRFAEARTELTEKALKMAVADHDMAYWTASTYALLGEKDAAFEWLERAIALGNENRQWFETDKNLVSIRDDQRFAELMQKITDNTQ